MGFYPVLVCDDIRVVYTTPNSVIRGVECVQYTMLVCAGASVCVCVCVCLCVCARARVCALKIVSRDKILRFKNIIINGRHPSTLVPTHPEVRLRLKS